MPRLNELLAEAERLEKSVTDGLPADEIRSIERQHEALLPQIEAARMDDLRGRASAYGLDWSRYEDLKEPEIRERMWNDLAERSAGYQIRSNTGTDHMTFSNPQTRIAAMGEALYQRLNPSHAPSEMSREFVGMSIRDLAARSLAFAGHGNTALSSAQTIERALNTTSDFPLILGDTVGRVLRNAYQAAPSGLKMVARQSSAADFRAKRALQLSEGPRLEKVNEAGEFKRGTFKEAGESYKIDTFGKVFGITRQALVNDDLAAFDAVPRKLGQAASAFEAQFLADLLASNPVMSDGHAVFSAAHSNIAASGALQATTLSAARAAMRGQTGLSGELISVTPRFLVVPSALETDADQMVALIQPAKVEDVNVFAAKLQVVVEPRLADPAKWYLAADPAEIDGLEFAYLEGDVGPQIDSRAGFDVDGIEIRVRLDFGAGFIDHRGWYKSGSAS